MTKPELEKKVSKLIRTVQNKDSKISNLNREVDLLKADYEDLDRRYQTQSTENGKYWRTNNELVGQIDTLINNDSTLKAMVKLVNKS